jgi:lipopolysaccharide/colanic/teichoic acid biosynthesis glycosyltransferase
MALPMIAIGLAIILTSGRGVFFKQRRVGLDGRAFEMLKFRTMHPDAEAATGPVWTGQRDERCTSIGRLLRRSSLDELPQLVNVLRGDMSLVGPRPERAVFVDEFATGMTWYRFRNRIRPGLTGWAQANGLRGNSSIDSRVQYDNWYVEHWSALLDIKILCMTLVEVFRGRNAY